MTLSLLKNDEFRSPKAVVDFFRSEVTKNETPDQAGLEEEIIVLDHEGKAISHERFQEFLWDLISALPQGLAIAGTHIDGSTIPVLMGTFSDGSIQPETNTSLVEFAHNPCDSAWGHFIQSRRFSKQLHATAANHGLYVVGSGAVPTMSWGDFQRDDIIIPNSSFAYSVQHMRQGTRPEYCRTVYGTAGIHHNMGFNDPELMAQYITTSLRMQPTMIALLGNSPFWDSAPAYNGGRPIVSYRSLAQINYGKIFGSGDGVSYLYPDFLIDQSADFAAIINGYLDLPLDRTIVAGQKQPCPGLTMRHYLNGYAVDDRVHYPSVAALIMMIREPIVDVRPSFVGAASRVETRSHDCVSQHCAVAIDAFYRGILANLDKARKLMAGMDGREIRRSRLVACEQGLAAAVRHRDPTITTQQDLALRLLAIAEEGLSLRNRAEEPLLAPLFVLAESGFNPGQRLLFAYRHNNKAPLDLLQAMDYGQNRFADGQSYAWPDSPPRARRTIVPVSGRKVACSL